MSEDKVLLPYSNERDMNHGPVIGFHKPIGQVLRNWSLPVGADCYFAKCNFRPDGLKQDVSARCVHLEFIVGIRCCGFVINSSVRCNRNLMFYSEFIIRLYIGAKLVTIPVLLLVSGVYFIAGCGINTKNPEFANRT